MGAPADAIRLHVVPLELTEANAAVAAWHRHHKPAVGHRFSVGVVDDDGIVRGACIVGRPVARLAGHPRDVLEVVRVSTDGTPNACSMLYGAAARAGQALGFRRIQTYTLPEEGGGVPQGRRLGLRGRRGRRAVETHRREAAPHRPARRGQDAVGEGMGA